MTDVAAIMRARRILDDSERERHRQAYQAILDAALKAQETGQDQSAGFTMAGCEVVVKAPA